MELGKGRFFLNATELGDDDTNKWESEIKH